MSASATTSHPRRRERRHACSKYLRRVKGQRYQIRWWLGVQAGQVNGGLYASEWLAERVRDRLIGTRFDLTPLDFWRALVAVLAEFAARGYDDLPAPLPRYVRRCRGGTGFYAEVRRGGRRIVCPGPFADPVEAHLAMNRLLAAQV